jgi:hypothetical protein
MTKRGHPNDRAERLRINEEKKDKGRDAKPSSIEEISKRFASSLQRLADK